MLNPCGWEIHCLGGRQAGGTRVSHLAQAGTQAGRQAGMQAGRHSFDGKEKQGRPQRKPSILACRTSLGAKDVKSLRRGNPLFGGGRGHTSQPLGAGRHAGRQAGRQAGMQAGRQAALMGRKSKAGRNVNPLFLLEGRV